MKMDKKFNENWFNSWRKITKIEPHYARGYDQEGNEMGEPAIDRIDIIFDGDSRIRIQAEDYNRDAFEGQEMQPFPYLEIKIQEFKEVKPIGEIEEKETKK